MKEAYGNSVYLIYIHMLKGDMDLLASFFLCINSCMALLLLLLDVPCHIILSNY